MSRKLLVALFAVSAFSVAATSAFALGTANAVIADITTLGITGYTPSTNVGMSYQSDTHNAVTYGMALKHLSGNKTFGTTSGYSSIAWAPSTAGTAIGTGDTPTAAATASDTSVPSGGAATGAWNTQ